MAALSQVEVDEFLDTTIGDNFKILPDVLKQLNKDKIKLSNQLTGQEEGEDKRDEDKDSWQTVSRDTRRVISQLTSLKEHCTNLKSELNTFNDKEQEEKEAKSGVMSCLSLLKELEQLRHYLLWIDKGHQLSTKIVSKLKGNGVITKESIDVAVTCFTELISLSNTLKSSQCDNLKQYITSLCVQRKTELNDHLTSEFNDLLKTINWPVTKETSTKSLKLWQQKEASFQATFKHLLTIDVPRHSDGCQEIPNIDDPLPLPMELLLTPFRKRFKFHFCGDRQTNSKEKPEWFFTQVSTWINDHTHFMETQIQPILMNTPTFNHFNAKVEFIRGLIQEIVYKLHIDLKPDSTILDDNYLFSHLIDELLHFEHELRTTHDYPILYPSTLTVLLEEGPLYRWFNIERQFAVEKLKDLMETPNSWEPLYNETVDDSKVPQCAERLMQLIVGITERFRHIPSLYVKLQFLELQSDLLLEFHQDLSDNVSQVEPLSSIFSSYFNAAHYIGSILNKWGEETFFLELHYYAKQLSANTFKKTPLNEMLHQIELLRKLDPDYAQLEGTAFENVIKSFNTLCDHMESRLIELISKRIKSSITDYKRERWHNFPTLQDNSEIEVTPSLVTFLHRLQYILHTITTSISVELLDSIFDKICVVIDDTLLQQVVYTNHFNEGGSAQLQYDINRIMVPLLSQYMNRLPSAINILLKSCDAVKLLTQDSVALQVMISLCKQVTASTADSDQDVTHEILTTLMSWNIQSLDPSQILKILESRIIN